MAQWKRASHYALYKQFDCPLFSTTVSLDVTQLREYARREGQSFFLMSLYVFAKALNGVEEFRYREENGRVWLYDHIDIVTPVMAANGEFSQVLLPWALPYESFASTASPIIEEAAREPALACRYDTTRTDYFVASCTPWYTFTHESPALASFCGQFLQIVRWGRADEIGGKVTMPMAIQCNHVFTDGVHLAKMLALLEEILHKPEEL